MLAFFTTVLGLSLADCTNEHNYIDVTNDEPYSARIQLNQERLYFFESEQRTPLPFESPPVKISFCKDSSEFYCFYVSEKSNSLWNFSFPKKDVERGFKWIFSGKELTVNNKFVDANSTIYIVTYKSEFTTQKYVFDNKHGLLLMSEAASKDGTASFLKQYMAFGIAFGPGSCLADRERDAEHPSTSSGQSENL